MPPDIYRPKELPGANPELQRRYQIAASKVNLAQNIQKNLLERRERAWGNVKNAFEKTKLFESEPNVDKVQVTSLQKDLEGHVSAIQKCGSAIEQAINDPSKPELQKSALELLWGRMMAMETTLQSIEKNPVTGAGPNKEVVLQIRQWLNQFYALFPLGAYGRTEAGPSQYVYDQVATAGKLVVFTLSSAYFLYATLAGWESGNLMPAAAGAAAVGWSVFGDRLFEGPSGRLLHQTEFLDQDATAAFLKKYGISGKVWAEYVDGLRTSSPKPKWMELSKQLQAATKNGKTDAVKMAEAKKNIVEALDVPSAFRPSFDVMMNTPADFAQFMRLCTEGTGSETHMAIKHYIENGCPRDVFKTARNPQMLAEKGMPPRRNPNA